ncbi:MAG: hypothetical protein Q9205_003156 [Flavoplaca limonia]
METDRDIDTANHNGPDLTIPELDSSPEADNIAEEVAAPSPDTSELQPRQIGFSGYDQPPKKPVQDAARNLQAAIQDEDIRPRGNCWVLQRNNHDCRKKLQDRKGVFPLSAFNDCYDKKKCPKKRDVIVEIDAGPSANDLVERAISSPDDSANNVDTQIHVNPCSWGWEIKKEKGKDKLSCLPDPRRSIRRSTVAGLKEGDLPESIKRDVPAAVEYYSASTSTSTPSSDITLNYLKCKDFCKFDKSSPPTCLPNCYVIDGQIQLDVPLLLIPPPATVTTSEASIDTSTTTFQTSTTSAVPMDTLLASRDHIEERAPPDEKSLDKREDVVPDPMPKALTDRTNTPAINTAAFRKLDGNILAAVSVESAKKVGNKAAGHNGKRTESDQAPKVSALEDPYGKDEDKKNKRAMEERGLDISQNLPKGHPNNDMFDKEKKDRRGDGLGTSREISSSDADTNPHDIRSNTLPLHKCGSAICLLRRAFNSLTSKRDAPPSKYLTLSPHGNHPPLLLLFTSRLFTI